MFYDLPAGMSNLVYGIVALVSLSILFFFLFFLNIYILERISHLLYKKKIAAEEEVHLQAVSLLETARRQAFDIIREANTKAQDILNKSGVVGSDANESLRKEIELLHDRHVGFLQDLSKDTLSAYKNLIEAEKGKGISAINDTVSNVESITSDALVSLKTEIDSQRKTYEDSLGNTMKEELDKVRDDLKGYREKKLLEIDSEIEIIIKNVSKNVLGKSLSLKDHEDLLIKSLDEAKIVGVFNDE